MFRKILFGTAVVTLMTVTATAQAADWYVGFGAGRTYTTADAYDIHPNLPAENPLFTTQNTSDYGWKATIGRKINNDISVELIYARFGQFDMEAILTPPPDDTSHARVKPEAICLAVVGDKTVNKRWSFLGRVGVCAWKDNFFGYHDTGYIEPEASDGTDLMFGIGFDYQWTRRVSLRFEGEIYRNVVHGHEDASLFSVGIVYRF